MTGKNRIHLAIIPDGNRRWAKKHGLLPWQGHEKAINQLKEIADWCRDNYQISVLTLWLFSTENWGRDKKEITMLMKLLEQYLKKNIKDLKRQKTRLVHSGRKDRLPASLLKMIELAEVETVGFSDFTLNLAIDYGGKDEVARTVSKIIQENNSKEISEELIRSNLDHPEISDIDVIIRTSGERRTSNFFLWQAAYSEWFFTDKLLPDLTVKDVAKVIEEFGERKRRYGK